MSVNGSVGVVSVLDSKDRPLGLVLVDNVYAKEKIRHSNLVKLFLFASFAAKEIQNARLLADRVNHEVRPYLTEIGTPIRNLLNNPNTPKAIRGELEKILSDIEFTETNLTRYTRPYHRISS